MSPDAMSFLSAAVHRHRQGEVEHAEALYREALSLDPANVDALGNYAVLANSSGRQDLAIELLNQAIEHNPEAGWLRSNLGEIYRSQERIDEAVVSLEYAIALSPEQVEAHISLGNAYRQKVDLDKAITSYRRAIELNPRLPEAYNNLGLALHENGLLKEAVQSLERAIELNPTHVNAYYNLGNVLQDSGRREEAISSYRKAVDLAPDFACAHANLGDLLRKNGNCHKAVESLQTAVHLDSSIHGAHNNLGAALQAVDRLDEAVASFRKALEISPEDVASLYNLGSCLKNLAQLEEAERCLRRVIELAPESADAHMSLANVLKAQGRIDEAVTNYRTAIQTEPHHVEAHSNLLLALNYENKHTPEEIFDAHRAWARQYVGEAPASPVVPHDDSERIRVGYVSGDFRSHSVSHFIEPILRTHDRAQFAVYTYAQVYDEFEHPDATTERLRGLVDKWCSTVGMSDEDLAEQVRGDRIHVLVDLAGHTAGNRLRMFGLRPAPVQISYIGYPNTTGLAAMDYRITDRYADPEDRGDAYCTETLIRLDKCFLCYRPIVDSPEVAPLPALKRGYVTFGSFNALPKIGEEVVATWAEILSGVPHARLLLKSPSFEDGQTRERYLSLFAEANIKQDRIALHGFIPDNASHLAMYHHVDIALDPFPYNGCTTTCEAMWMGVPVVTLVGDRHAGRVGLSLLTQVGMEELCTETRASYVNTALELALNTDRLSELRSHLRDRLRQSPLCDEHAFTRTLERVYKDLLHLF